MTAKTNKIIALPTSIIKDLKLVAFNADKSVKKYMEDVIIADIKAKAAKTKK